MHKTDKQHKTDLLTRASILAIAVVFVLAGVSVPRLASADRFERQIRELQQENSRTQAQVNSLASEAASYEQAIQRLRAEISSIERQIAANERKQAEIQRQIDQLQRDLQQQRAVLGENIKAMYVNGEMTTIEMLATSKDLSDFVDRETYRSAVQRQIQETMEKIERLQNELSDKKQEVETLIMEQKAQRSTLDASRAEQSRLLAMNQQQQDAFTRELKANNKRIADLRVQQAIENARLFGGGEGTLGGGGYPWGLAKCIHTGKVEGPCANYDWAVGGSIWNWNTGGWGYRNCTDWVAFRSGRIPDAGTIRYWASQHLGTPATGDAKFWDDAARGMGRPVNTSPAVGAVAVSNAGTYGHVMYVEAVQGGGTIVVSDYNRAGTGKYSTATLERVGNGQYRNPNNGAVSHLTFAHF